MTSKDNLRKQRTGTLLIIHLKKVMLYVNNKFGVKLEHEAKKKQAKGNAIERLGKNVIGFRTVLLNKIRVHNEGPNGIFNRGSFYFREKLWSSFEMAEKMMPGATAVFSNRPG
jgi:hypothetical protein